MENKLFFKNLHHKITEETVFINGYIIPGIAIIVLTTNIFVIIIYSKQYRQTTNKIRRVSSILYVSIATANILSSFPHAIWNFHLFTLGKVNNFMPFHYCWIWNFMQAFVLFPHMASIWFVTILSVQRYTIIRHPFTSHKTWTIKRMYVTVGIIWILTFIIQIPHAFDTGFRPKNITSNSTMGSSIKLGCSLHYADWIRKKGDLFHIVTYFLKLIFFVIIPSILIIYSDSSLVHFLRGSAVIRKSLIKHPSQEKDENTGSVKSQGSTNMRKVLVKAQSLDDERHLESHHSIDIRKVLIKMPSQDHDKHSEFLKSQTSVDLKKVLVKMHCQEHVRQSDPVNSNGSSNIQKRFFKIPSQEKDQHKESVRSDTGFSQRDICTRNRENRHQTLLVVILSTIVFLVEIPYAVLCVSYIYFYLVKKYEIIFWLWVGPVENVFTMTMHVSYPTLFILSCLLSRQFRKLFVNIFRKKEKLHFLHKNMKTSHEDICSQQASLKCHSV